MTSTEELRRLAENCEQAAARYEGAELDAEKADYGHACWLAWNKYRTATGPDTILASLRAIQEKSDAPQND